MHVLAAVFFHLEILEYLLHQISGQWCHLHVAAAGLREQEAGHEP
jgi:hypothetical protein